jgi:hypothetical protein
MLSSTRLRSLALALLLGLLVGCGPLASERGHLAISPSAVYFAGAPEGKEASATVVLYNVGDAPLEIAAVQLGISTGHLVEAPPLPRALDPGEELELRVRRSAGQGVPEENALEVMSDDPAQPSLRVALQAPRAAALLVASPSALDFGAVPSGGATTREVLLRNLGLGIARAVGIEWVAGSSQDFAASLSGVELESGASSWLRLRYTPRGGDTDHAQLRVRSAGEQAGSVLIALTGRQDLSAPD